MAPVEELKLLIRESDVPYFTNSELQYYIDSENGDIKRAAYKCLIIKSEDTTLQVSGLNTADTSAYYKRLANMYRPSNTGVLTRGGVIR